MLKIALIGYGKMGKTIEQVSKERGHKIVARIDCGDFKPTDLHQADVAIEFTQPSVAHLNIAKCFDADIPVVVGTTAWYEHYETLAQRAISEKKTLFTATNFSIGVNVLFHINEHLGRIMNNFKQYDVHMTETHHVQKLDHPSGTAVTLAEGILSQLDRKNNYIGLLEGQKFSLSPLDLHIECKRSEGVPGYHAVTYESEIDEITLSHNAKNRLGFAQGAVLAAEWVATKKGVYGMKDLLQF